MGDLRDSTIILNNYLEGGSGGGKIPWDDLKYLFGEIMYGGHIVNNWDRVMCAAMLNSLMTDGLLDEIELFPFIDGKNVTFKSPPQNLSYEKYAEYIDTETPSETPLAFGLHPNAEIDFRTQQCVNLFRLLQEIQPRDAGADGGGSDTVQDRVQAFMVRVNDECSLDSNKLNIEEIISRIQDDSRGPYQNSFLQECEVMNNLILIIVGSLRDIELAFKGELTMTENMETLMNSIFFNTVPASWSKYAFPSSRGLGSWLDNLKQRLD
jgi:dynein heavy chain